MVQPTPAQSSQQGQFLPCTPQQFFNARDFSSQSAFHEHALEAISTATSHHEIIYRDVPPSWGESVVVFLNEKAEHTGTRKHYNSATRTFWARIMPTDIHDCHVEWFVDEKVRWVVSGLITYDEGTLLKVRGNTTINFFYPPYAPSRKEPDFMIRAGNQRLPSVVIESGWSESLPRLHDDMNVWLVGGNGYVKAALILNWHRIGNSNTVRGNVELYTLDANGIPTLRQDEPIFPAPPPQQAQAQTIRLTRRILFATALPQGRNPNDIFTLRLDPLRHAARDALALMGLAPV